MLKLFITFSLLHQLVSIMLCNQSIYGFSMLTNTLSYKLIPELYFYRRRSDPARNEKDKEKPIRFAVRSLGWVDISEIDLTPERSSKAVNRCIVELSFGKNGLIDNVGRWGDVC